ncbi:hypothetical protein BU15DRAFT_69657 [Melanogaster broomeanus]|nr:hypothetical protein BU15DRAFT_69657 [Melanogaster broomeanus]
MPADTFPCPRPLLLHIPRPGSCATLLWLRLKLAVAAINSSIPNDHVWQDLALEVALINRIFFTGNVNKQFMQLPSSQEGDALQDQSLPEILAAIPLADDDSDISFKFMSCRMFGGPPIAHRCVPTMPNNLWPMWSRRPILFAVIADVGHQRKLLADMLQKKKEELQLVEYELATVGDRMTTMEDTFWSDLL